MSHLCLYDGCGLEIAEATDFCTRHARMLPFAFVKEISDLRRAGDKQAWYDALARARRSIAEAERMESDTALIVGNTYPVREELKALGGVWDATAKGWRVPKQMKLVAEVLVGNAEQVESLDL